MNDVLVDVRADHVVITLNRPPVNAMTVAMFDAVSKALDESATRGGPVLIGSSSGRFCAGLDVREVGAGRVTVDRANASARACLERVAANPGPVVAAVEGAAVGFGCLLAMSADILVVHPETRVGMPEVKLGVVPGVGPLLSYLSKAWMRRVVLLGELATAHEIGLGSAGAVVSERVTEVAHELVNALCDREAAVLASTKGHWRSTAHSTSPSEAHVGSTDLGGAVQPEASLDRSGR